MNENKDKIVVRADARAMSAVTALDVRVSPRWKSSGTKSGECVSIFPDGTRIPFVRTRSTSPATRLRTVRNDNAKTYFDRVNQLGATGDVD